MTNNVFYSDFQRSFVSSYLVVHFKRPLNLLNLDLLYSNFSKILNKYSYVDGQFYFLNQLVYLTLFPENVKFLGDPINYVKIRREYVSVMCTRKINKFQYTERYTGFSNVNVYFIPFNWFTRDVIFYNFAGNCYAGNSYYKIFSVGYTPISYISERDEIPSAYSDPLSIVASDVATNQLIPYKLRPNGKSFTESTNIAILFPKYTQLLLYYSLVNPRVDSPLNIRIIDQAQDFTYTAQLVNPIAITELGQLSLSRVLSGNANIVGTFYKEIRNDEMIIIPTKDNVYRYNLNSTSNIYVTYTDYYEFGQYDTRDELNVFQFNNYSSVLSYYAFSGNTTPATQNYLNSRQDTIQYYDMQENYIDTYYYFGSNVNAPSYATQYCGNFQYNFGYSGEPISGALCYGLGKDNFLFGTKGGKVKFLVRCEKIKQFDVMNLTLYYGSKYEVGAMSIIKEYIKPTEQTGIFFIEFELPFVAQNYFYMLALYAQLALDDDVTIIFSNAYQIHLINTNVQFANYVGNVNVPHYALLIDYLTQDNEEILFYYNEIAFRKSSQFQRVEGNADFAIGGASKNYQCLFTRIPISTIDQKIKGVIFRNKVIPGDSKTESSLNEYQKVTFLNSSFGFIQLNFPYASDQRTITFKLFHLGSEYNFISGSQLLLGYYRNAPLTIRYLDQESLNIDMLFRELTDTVPLKLGDLLVDFITYNTDILSNGALVRADRTQIFGLLSDNNNAYNYFFVRLFPIVKIQIIVAAEVEVVLISGTNYKVYARTIVKGPNNNVVTLFEDFPVDAIRDYCVIFIFKNMNETDALTVAQSVYITIDNQYLQDSFNKYNRSDPKYASAEYVERNLLTFQNMEFYPSYWTSNITLNSPIDLRNYLFFKKYIGGTIGISSNSSTQQVLQCKVDTITKSRWKFSLSVTNKTVYYFTPPEPNLYDMNILNAEELLPIATVTINAITYTLPAKVFFSTEAVFEFGGRDISYNDFTLAISSKRFGFTQLSFSETQKIDILFFAKNICAGNSIFGYTNAKQDLYDNLPSSQNENYMVQLGNNITPRIDIDTDWKSLGLEIEIYDYFYNYVLWQISPTMYENKTTNINLSETFESLSFNNYKFKRNLYFQDLVNNKTQSNDVCFYDPLDSMQNGIRFLTKGFNKDIYLSHFFDTIQFVVFPQNSIIWNKVENGVYKTNNLHLPIQIRDYNYVFCYGTNYSDGLSIGSDTLCKRYDTKIQILFSKNESGNIVAPKPFLKSTNSFNLYLYPSRSIVTYNLSKLVLLIGFFNV